MKKLLSLVMTGVVALSALTACGSSQSTTAGTTAAGNAGSAETTAAGNAGSGTASGEEVVFGTGGTTGTYYAVG